MRSSTLGFEVTGLWIGRRCAIALAAILANAAMLLLVFRYDVLGVYGGPEGISCALLGLPERPCNGLQGYGAIRPLSLSALVVAVMIALGLYDPRPLIYRLEQNRRSLSWLALNAAGVIAVAFPYLIAAGGAPLSAITAWAPYAVLIGAAMMAGGLVLWLSDVRQLAGTVKLVHLLVFLALPLAPFAATELQGFLWEDLRAATFNTTVLLLRMSGENVTPLPEAATIQVNGFEVTVASLCSGIAGVFMVSAVLGGYILLLRRRLWAGRALLLIPFAAALSWLLNAVRISALLMIGA